MCSHDDDEYSRRSVTDNDNGYDDCDGVSEKGQSGCGIACNEPVYAEFLGEHGLCCELSCCKDGADGPVEDDDAVAAFACEELLVTKWLQHGNHLAHRQPAQTVQRVEAEQPQEKHVQIWKDYHVLDGGRDARTHGSADRHHYASGGQVGHRQRDHEQSRAIFTQFRISRDHGNHERICDYIQYNHRADDHCFHVDVYKVDDVRWIHDRERYLLLR